jgi:hypothetical protein
MHLIDGCVSRALICGAAGVAAARPTTQRMRVEMVGRMVLAVGGWSGCVVGEDVEVCKRGLGGRGRSLYT